jgi:hypothetical protein
MIQMATEHETPPAADDEPSLRDQIDAAFEAAATDEAPQAAPVPDGKARDEHGRFAAKAANDNAAPSADSAGNAAAGPVAPAPPAALGAAPAQAGAPAVSPAPPPGEIKAPASWRPEVREKWAALDPQVRQEVHRRESELQHVLQQSAQSRQFVDAFERLVQPYEVFIRAENSNPLQAVDNLMRTAAELRVGTPASKAQLIAGMITNFGIDLPMLDSILAGQMPAPGQAAAAQPQPFRDPRFDQFLAAQQQMLQQQAQQEDAQTRQTLQQFADAHEFYGDVAALMADLLEVRARRGEKPDLEKLYAEACKMHEGVSTIQAQRAAASKSSSHSAAVLRAKRAAASVKGDTTPDGGATVPRDDSIRAAIEAAIESGSNA